MLIYQMLLQQSPFRGEDEDEIYDAILADEPLYPIHMPRDSVSILQKLLTREPELRLGSGPTDAQEVMSHAFFRNINWDDIYHKRVPPPFLPTITSPTDTSNFDQEFTSVTPVLTPVQSGKQLSSAIFSSSADHDVFSLQSSPKPCRKNSAVSPTRQISPDPNLYLLVTNDLQSSQLLLFCSTWILDSLFLCLLDCYCLQHFLHWKCLITYP